MKEKLPCISHHHTYSKSEKQSKLNKMKRERYWLINEKSRSIQKIKNEHQVLNQANSTPPHQQQYQNRKQKSKNNKMFHHLSLPKIVSKENEGEEKKQTKKQKGIKNSVYKSFFHQQEDVKEKFKNRCRKEIQDFKLSLDKLPQQYIQTENNSMNRQERLKDSESENPHVPQKILASLYYLPK